MHLFFGWWMIIEIADEADADPVFVVIVVFGFAVSAGKLVGPAIADFDFAVSGLAAVADDKVIAQSVPSAFAMFLVKALGCAMFARAMVNDNAGPAGGFVLRHPAGLGVSRENGGWHRFPVPCQKAGDGEDRQSAEP